MRVPAAAARLAACVLALALALAAAGAALGQQDDPAKAAAAQRDRLAKIETTVGSPKSSLRTIEDLRPELRDLRAQAYALGDSLDGPLQDAKRAVDALGPAPAADAPPEAEPIAQQRKALTARQGEIEGLQRQADLNAETATRLLGRIAELRRERRLEGLLEARASAMQPQTWVSAGRGAMAAASLVSSSAGAWLAARREAGDLWRALFVAAVSAALALAISFPLRRLIFHRIDRLARRLGGEPPAPGLIPGLRALFHIAAAVVAGLVLLGAISSQGASEGPLGAMLLGALGGLVATAVADAVSRAWYAPADSSVRLAHQNDVRARLSWIYVVALAAAAAAGYVVASVGERLEGDPAALSAAGDIEGLVGGVLLLLLAFKIGRDPILAESPPETPPSRAPAYVRWLKVATALAGLAALGSAIGGYDRFSRFLVERAALAVVGVIAFRVIRAFVHALASRAIAPRHRAPEAGEDTFAFWTFLAIDLALLAGALPFAAWLAGVERDDIFEALTRASRGLRIGSIEISLRSLAAGVVVLIAALAVTRAAQRALSESVLPRTRMDAGARGSLVTLVGYAGLVLGLLFAVSAAGLDLTNLAIVAGALSVGVGLGLQGFVANFVSSLTLLFERPIKPGDWVVLPAGEGTVRKIGMRATEIETFDRSTVIVPNALLITQAFTNRTLRDRIGRITVPVSVSYDADPELVRRLLLGVAAENPEILGAPAPLALWREFGDTGLVFELRAHIRDVARSLDVQTDVRFAIWRVFKEQGIGITHQQRLAKLASDAPLGTG